MDNVQNCDSYNNLFGIITPMHLGHLLHAWNSTVSTQEVNKIVDWSFTL
jgi:hypothetical protein